jgi:hypothetical protein
MNFLPGLRVWFCRDNFDREVSDEVALYLEKQMD